MKNWRVELLLAAAFFAALLGAVRRINASRTPEADAATLAQSLAEAMDATAKVPLPVKNPASIEAINPFRFSNQPALVRHGDESDHVDGPRYRPDLQLAAVIGGPPWKALVRGIPGQTGPTIVAAGETIDSLTFIRIARDTVRVRGPDTTWTLVLPRGTP